MKMKSLLSFLNPWSEIWGVLFRNQAICKDLRNLCDKHKIILIFDEVMTGFRLSLGGAQELYGVKPDMTTLGKIIGGGLPVGAYGGKKEIMDIVSPWAGLSGRNFIRQPTGYGCRTCHAQVP